MMAIGGFDGTSHLRYLGTTATVDMFCPPVTIGAWVYYESTPPAAGHAIASVARNSTNRHVSISHDFVSPGNVFYISHSDFNSGRLTPRTATSGAGFTLNQWIYVSGSLDNTGITACWTNFARIYSSVNDTFVSTTAVSNTDSSPLPWDRLGVGVLYRSTITGQGPTGMYIAEVAMWNVALTTDEVRSIAKGAKSNKIRPDSLRVYLPGIRNLSSELVIGAEFTQIGTLEASDHPRRYG